jgi:hypothetical protein
MLSFDNSTAMDVLRPKNFTPWRDSNPGSSVLEVDTITTMPRRQGQARVTIIFIQAQRLQ